MDHVGLFLLLELYNLIMLLNIRLLLGIMLNSSLWIVVGRKVLVVVDVMELGLHKLSIISEASG